MNRAYVRYFAHVCVKLRKAMDLSRPYSAVTPSLDGDVLAVLARTTKPLTGREVARLSRRGSPRGTLDALDRLAVQGVVRREEAGRALLYTLNRDHLAAPAVEILAGLRVELVRRLRAAIAEWRVAPIHSSLFGSAARGDGGVESDIDLFFVRPDGVEAEDRGWRRQLADLERAVTSWTGNPAALMEVEGAAIARLRAEDAPIVASLQADAITLSGLEASELFPGA